MQLKKPEMDWGAEANVSRLAMEGGRGACDFVLLDPVP